jgi:hypothetical protein
VRFGHRPLVSPPTLVSELDLEASGDHRAWVHEQVRLRAHLLDLLSVAPIDEELVRVTRYEVFDGDADDPLESAS